MSFRKFSFFSSSKLSLSTITEIIYYWTYKLQQDFVIHETGLSNHTVVDFYNFLREVCSVILQEQSEAIGGPGKIAEIDESKFGKRKYNRGKRVDGVWVFGGIERDSTPPKPFFVPVSDRSAATLIPIIKRWILPGTTILSDCWKAYSSLEKEGFIHDTVNHNLHFITESGTHTNNIESCWNSLKKSLPKYGTAKQLYHSYFVEYCLCKKFINTSNDKFLEVLCLIGLVYNPQRGNETKIHDHEVVPACTDTSTVTHDTYNHPEDITSTVTRDADVNIPRMDMSTSASSTITHDIIFDACDIGHFDLNLSFNFSDDDIFEQIEQIC